jgi:hypothetical protein
MTDNPSESIDRTKNAELEQQTAEEYGATLQCHEAFVEWRKKRCSHDYHRYGTMWPRDPEVPNGGR